MNTQDSEKKARQNNTAPARIFNYSTKNIREKVDGF